MAVFTYSALKKDGSLTKGELTANDRSDAFRRLDRSGLQPVSLQAREEGAAASSAPAPDKKSAAADKKAPADTKSAAAPARDSKGANGKPVPVGKDGKPAPAALPDGPVKLKRKDVVMLTEELSDLLSAGLQLEPALRIMESRDELSGVKDVTSLMRAKLRDGSSFANALRTSSPSFGDLYCNLAAAGEISGALPKILRRQSEYLIAVQELQGKVTTAMIYPICLLVAGIGVSLLFVSYLIPQLASLLKSMDKPLPLPAQYLMKFTDFVFGWWWAIALVIGLIIYAFQQIVASPKYKQAWDYKRITLPFFGPLLSSRFYVQFLETLSNLVGNGLPLLRALELTREATVNLHLMGLLHKVIALVGEGGSLSRSLKKVGFFPPLLTDIITVGEQTGDLEHALERAASRYEKELQKTIDRGMAFITPVIILFMAVVVGTMAYMMISVILSSVTAIKR